MIIYDSIQNLSNLGAVHFPINNVRIIEFDTNLYYNSRHNEL